MEGKGINRDISASHIVIATGGLPSVYRGGKWRACPAFRQY